MPKIITEELIRVVALRARHIDQIVLQLNRLFVQYEINTTDRIAAFLAQTAYETSGFQWFQEAEYLDEERRRAYCSRYEPDQPAGRRLGNTVVGDGYRYRGRGLIQLTGRENYGRVGRALGLDLLGNPDLVHMDIGVACLVACEFWRTHRLNEYADRNDLEEITRRINGKNMLGLAERTAFYQALRQYMSAGLQESLVSLVVPTLQQPLPAAHSLVDAPQHNLAVAPNIAGFFSPQVAPSNNAVAFDGAIRLAIPCSIL